MINLLRSFAAIAALLVFCGNLSAQFNEYIYLADTRLDSSQVGEVRLNVGSLLFFRDNEFSTSVMDGYTLPGFKLQPKSAICRRRG